VRQQRRWKATSGQRFVGRRYPERLGLHLQDTVPARAQIIERIPYRGDRQHARLGRDHQVLERLAPPDPALVRLEMLLHSVSVHPDVIGPRGTGIGPQRHVTQSGHGKLHRQRITHPPGSLGQVPLDLEIAADRSLEPGRLALDGERLHHNHWCLAFERESLFLTEELQCERHAVAQGGGLEYERPRGEWEDHLVTHEQVVPVAADPPAGRNADRRRLRVTPQTVHFGWL
jgi:hypothetical protein